MNFSIVIPHKNRTELLKKLLGTIPLRDDLEVIIVDDNSNDEIVNFDNFPGQKRANTTIIYDKKGGGGGYARNIGLKHVKGKWVLFADSDDYFTSNFSEILHNYVDSNYDVVYFKAKSVDIETGDDSFRAIGLNDYIDLAIDKDDYNHLKYEVAYPVAKMIKTKIIINNNIQFEEIPNGNDVFFSLNIGLNVNDVFAVNEYIYTITTRAEHKLEKSAISIYKNIYNVFLRKSHYLKNINLKQYATPNLLAYWARVYNCSKREGLKLIPKTISAAGLLDTLNGIYKPIWYKFLADVKSTFPKTWGLMKKAKTKCIE